MQDEGGLFNYYEDVEEKSRNRSEITEWIFSGIPSSGEKFQGI
jgi:hypothetical protein